MGVSIYDKVLAALQQAEKHNSSLMTRPEVILWPDPENIWSQVMPVLQETRDNLFIYGSYEPQKNQGPSIWIKCMLAKSVPEATWSSKSIPTIYLPGISKNELKNVEEIGFQLQPLIEYQYTGTMFLQENGKEWTAMAFIENQNNGLGIRINKDTATKEALKKALPTIFQDKDIFKGKYFINADFLNSQLFPDIVQSILTWICLGDAFLDTFDSAKKDVFVNICKAQYDFVPNYKNIKAIAEKLGTQKNGWKSVWQLYANAPAKYPQIEDLLRLAKPDDLGTGMFAVTEESWPQVNEQKEEDLRNQLAKIATLDLKNAASALNNLEQEHKNRRNWIWFELGKAPLLKALIHLSEMAAGATAPFPASSVNEIRAYYISEGYKIDGAMRNAFAAVKTDKDKTLIKQLIQHIYKPWLENINLKFQALIAVDSTIFTNQQAVPEQDDFVLFVDAFRYELAVEFMAMLSGLNYTVTLENSWSAIPSLTPTAKPNVSPIAAMVATESLFNEFRPQLKTGKDLQTNEFRKALKDQNFRLISNVKDISPDIRCWKEIGDIDTKGHTEQADMVKSIPTLFEQIQESLDLAFEKGVKKIKIVTDHGWLLLPGGLPKTAINAGLTETRWGRCALIKDGVSTDFLHLPWRWNPAIFIAYAPGISFFRINEEYAHGGISIQECLTPTIYIENTGATVSNAKIMEVKWVNLKCTVVTENADNGYYIDIRSKYSDENTSVLENKNKPIRDNKVFVMATDDSEAQAATVVLLNENGRIIDKKVTTVGE